MARDFAKKFYSSKVWQDCRNTYGARRGWLCEDCLQHGRYTPGEEVHHVEELTPYNIHRPEVTLNADNLVLLCRECHRARHKIQNKKKRYQIGINGEIIITDPPGQL